MSQRLFLRALGRHLGLNSEKKKYSLEGSTGITLSENTIHLSRSSTRNCRDSNPDNSFRKKTKFVYDVNTFSDCSKYFHKTWQVINFRFFLGLILFLSIWSLMTQLQRVSLMFKRHSFYFSVTVIKILFLLLPRLNLNLILDFKFGQLVIHFVEGGNE